MPSPMKIVSPNEPNRLQVFTAKFRGGTAAVWNRRGLSPGRWTPET